MTKASRSWLLWFCRQVVGFLSAWASQHSRTQQSVLLQQRTSAAPLHLCFVDVSPQSTTSWTDGSSFCDGQQQLWSGPLLLSVSLDIGDGAPTAGQRVPQNFVPW